MEQGAIPSSPEAEEAVLGSLLIDSDAVIDIAEALDAKDFYREKNGWIYQAIVDLAAAGEPADFVTLVEALESRGQLKEVGGAAYITALVNSVPSAVYAEYYAGIVRGLSYRRKLIATASRLATLAYDPAHDPAQIQAEIMAELTGYDLGTAGSEPEHIKKPVGELLDVLQHGGSPAMSTGYKTLDKALNGGLRPGHLFILAARPSVGKTAMALNLAYRMAKRGVASGFFSLEMSKMELAGRVMSIAGSVPNNIFNDPELAKGLTGADWTSLLEIAGTVTESEITIDDTAGIYLNDLYTKVKRMKARSNIGVIFIDYLQLIRVKDKDFHSRSLEVGFVSAYLKRMARELKICIVAVSQLNRAIEGRVDGKPQLSDLRESGSIEQDADVVAFLYREDMTKPTSTRHGIIDVILGKVRNGAIGEVPLAYTGEFLQFNELQQQGAVPPMVAASNEAIVEALAEITGGNDWTQGQFDTE
jgi:replicative DNA helicase